MRLSAPLAAVVIAFAIGFPVLAFGAGDSFAGPVTHEEYETALAFFRPAAERGDPVAQYDLGRLYSQGRGAAPDYPQAIVWFRKAAAQGHADAQTRLGELLARGQGAPKDLPQALAWYRKAAAQGNADALFALAQAVPEAATAAPRAPAAMIGPTRRQFAEEMNDIFGAGRWRQTSGYRSIAAENRLRAEGALTVPLGVISHHSMGTPDAPGAYDIVVAGMSPGEAAVKIRRSGAAFRRLFPEAAHGDQGPHLHVEPVALGRGL
ncbi:MAG TPA: tetratricopeptide repeat protein [Caulobacteraceae bacterium]